MNKVLTAVIAVGLFFGLSGCGFKSDLSLPDTKSRTPLFEPDMLPEIQSPEEPPILLSPPDAESATSGVPVEIATMLATDGRILVTPDEGTTEGVPVDLSNLSLDVNLSDLIRDGENNTQ